MTAIELVPDPSLSQWFTPEWLATRMVEWADPTPEMTVLEPAAGNGRIASAILHHGAKVIACELDGRLLSSLVEAVEATGKGDNARVYHNDFLRLRAEPTDMAIMNPPYEGGLDVAFILRAFAWTRRVVALVRTTTFSGVERRDKLWAQVGLERVAFLSGRPKFGGPFTPRADFALIDVCPALRTKPRDCPSVEFW